MLGEHVHQRSNITAERMRFDFSHPTKLTDGEKEQVEEFVNDSLARGRSHGAVQRSRS
jgi:alanyl-tRNA synthetase